MIITSPSLPTIFNLSPSLSHSPKPLIIHHSSLITIKHQNIPKSASLVPTIHPPSTHSTQSFPPIPTPSSTHQVIQPRTKTGTPSKQASKAHQQAGMHCLIVAHL
ncbi:predicted protein [Sclerotinia sclerotiorum 1980 UF-70]|uniref:Uncharacterized protein n=1 Tax=Sclerotinia sclerotiorum (strain ATCC 18683 / 1980 / Ss-1) TaxID=665079 RepID=A7EYA8_SCLS1|nr:predicted protein [Sclerotinia sclerotiorum 1980 UF-70]EDN94450.1 predicted protein [Sclerotinia sclerotiorum 1980 UF-70]